MNLTPSFDAWVASVDPRARADPLWRMTAYRLGMYVLEIGWSDATKLDRMRIVRPVGPQLYRALGSIPANIAEGYSRSSGADRARFFEYALGSTRESSVWYAAARPVLGDANYDGRTDLLSQIRRLLLTAIPAERTRRVRPIG